MIRSEADLILIWSQLKRLSKNVIFIKLELNIAGRGFNLIIYQHYLQV